MPTRFSSLSLSAWLRLLSSGLVALAWCIPAGAQLLQYPDPSLDSVFPAGAQRGQSVAVELRGLNGLEGASEVVIDGAPGVSVTDVKAVNAGLVQATFSVSADALPGRRRVRVKGGRNGLTNFRSFFVGGLPEIVEQEPDGKDPDAVLDVSTPVVINGVLNPALDVDTYRFMGRKGERLVAAVLAHRMDTLTRQGSDRGFLDTSLELLDDAGTILASAEDTLGLDPLIHCELPADGTYRVRVRSLSYAGYAQAVYRLTLGEVPYPIAVFPAGGRRGETIEVEFFGPNVPPGTKRSILIEDDPFPLQDVALDEASAGDPVLTLVRGDPPEVVETLPNESAAEALAITLPVMINGRFETPGDSDWYVVPLKKGEGVRAEVLAQRHLLSSVDTLLEVLDASGKRIAENDDGRPFANEGLHDFASLDSWLAFTAPADGDYYIRIQDQARANPEQAVYRLALEPLLADFRLYQWPDTVPIWGGGTTAALVVQVLVSGGLKSDIELRIVDLPPGWTGSTCHVPSASFAGYNGTEFGAKALLTITAPAEAPLGTSVPFRVVGKALDAERIVERTAQPLSLLGNSHNDRMHLRHSPESRAVVAGRMDAWPETAVTELTVRQGETAEIPVRVHRSPDAKGEISITVDGQTAAASCAWRSPFALASGQSEVTLPLPVPTGRAPGTYSITVSRAWASDLRGGRPGPCTPLIRLNVLPKE